MKIAGIPIQKTEIEITKQQVAYLLFEIIFDKIGYEIDDAGCDWFTEDGHTYIAHDKWHVSSDSNVAILVDAINIILYSEPLKLEE